MSRLWWSLIGAVACRAADDIDGAIGADSDSDSDTAVLLLFIQVLPADLDLVEYGQPVVVEYQALGTFSDGEDEDLTSSRS